VVRRLEVELSDYLVTARAACCVHWATRADLRLHYGLMGSGRATPTHPRAAASSVPFL